MKDEKYDYWRLEDQFVEFVQFVAKNSFAFFAVSILRKSTLAPDPYSILGNRWQNSLSALRALRGFNPA